MFKQAKNSLEDLSRLDTVKYLKLAKKIKKEHENPSNKLDTDLKSMLSNNPRYTKDLSYALKLNRLF